MKTLLIVSERNWDDHVGEEYDSILEVVNQPTSEVIEELHNRIRGRIRKLWHEDDTPKGATRDEDNPQEVHIWLDAASPFNAMLIDLEIVMTKEEGIIIELPYLEEDGMGVPETTDPEALSVIEKLDRR